jgi:AbrB family looped-hinge helix DNA binding protein
MTIASAKVTSKGQITLPVELRRELGLKPGDRVDFRRGSRGAIELAARTVSLLDLKGMLATDSKFSRDEIATMVDAVRSGRAGHVVAVAGKRRKS